MHIRTFYLPMILCLALFARLARAQEGPTAVYVMDVDGSQARMIAHVDGYSTHYFPRWSHDGKQVAFDALPTTGIQHKLFVVQADGSKLRELGIGWMPFWSHDDKQLAFYVFGANGRAQLVVQNLDGQGKTPLGPGKSPCWSPDGSLMASTDGQNVTLTEVVSGDTKNLFSESFFEVFRGFRFTPDGKRLAVTVRPEEGAQRNLLLVDVQGTENAVKLRLKSEQGGFVSFSPDGKRLMYASGYMIYIVDVDGNNPSQLIPGQRGRSFHPDWSPDGKRVVFVSNRDIAN
jgi:Tol biopolymer transport system component